MKFGKRQLVLAALVVALGAAVYLNWQFSDNSDLLAANTTVESGKELGEAEFVNNNTASSLTSSTEENTSSSPADGDSSSS